jgi:hypothetical protein
VGDLRGCLHRRDTVLQRPPGCMSPHTHIRRSSLRDSKAVCAAAACAAWALDVRCARNALDRILHDQRPSDWPDVSKSASSANAREKARGASGWVAHLLTAWVMSVASGSGFNGPDHRSDHQPGVDSLDPCVRHFRSGAAAGGGESAVGAEAAYDAVADAYSAAFDNELDSKPVDRALLTAFTELIGPASSAMSVVVPGNVTRFLAERHSDVMGLDLSRAMIDVGICQPV